MFSRGEQFKGWTIPGEIPNRKSQKLNFDAIAECLNKISEEAGEEVTLDGLSGHYQIFQLKRGHRYSTDDVLVAWYGTSICPSAKTHLDLGTGIGSVGMMVNWRLPVLKSIGVEAQARSVMLCKMSLAHNQLEERYEVRLGDLRNQEILRNEDKEERFDLITSSPPYFDEASGILGNHPQKVECRFEIRGTIADYAKTASRHLSPGGVFVTVFPINPTFQEQRVIDAAKSNDLIIFRYRPVVLKQGDSPLLGLFAMMHQQDLPAHLKDQCWREPDLVIRDSAGKITPEYRCIKLSMGLPPTS